MKHVSVMSKMPAKALADGHLPWWASLFGYWQDPVGTILAHLPLLGARAKVPVVVKAG